MTEKEKEEEWIRDYNSYLLGKEAERKLILKIIDKKIKIHEFRLGDMTSDMDEGYFKALRELRMAFK